jgi:hypothetical protein
MQRGSLALHKYFLCSQQAPKRQILPIRRKYSCIRASKGDLCVSE